MVTRDVDLVIRTKDESSKAADAITKALNELVDGIKNAGKDASSADSTFSKLGKTLGTLEKAFRGVSSTERLSQQMDRASAATGKLQVEVESTVAEVDRLSRELTEASETTAKYRARVEQTTAALNKEETAIKAARTAHAQTNAALREAGSARGQLETQERRLSATVAEQEARLVKQQQRLEAVSAEIAAVDEPTKRMVASFNAANAALEKTTAQIASTKTQLASVRDGLTQAVAAETQYTAAVQASEAALVAQKANLAALKKEKQEITATARAAATAERQLATAVDGATNAWVRAQTGADKAQAALAEIETSTERAGAAFRELAQAAQGPLTDAFRAQQAVVSRINNAYQDNRQALAALSALMGQVGVPTREMSEAMNRLNTVARETATEYRNQQNILRELRASLQTAASDTSELAAKQKQFVTAVEGGAAALTRVTQEITQAGNASNRIIAANEKAARSYRQVATEAKTTEAATNQLAQANDRAAQSYNRQANASRQSMSYVQRLRGEVLSLVSAYGGIYGVISILNQAVQAYQKLEAAQSRLNAIFRGDQGAQAQELDFIRRNADRLGIEFGALADEYTKFAAATKNTNIEGQKTRDIFLAVAEAGVVNKLSIDDMNGIFRALIQIASKGKVQLEELSGQLGDRLPGALQIMADGLGITTEELLGMTKQGEVTSEALVNFADELTKRYGPALAASLASSRVAVGGLANAATQALVVFANAGFMEGFIELVNKLTVTLKSADFLTFAANAGAAFGVLAKALGVLAENFQLVVVAATAFAGMTIVPAVLRFGASLLQTAGILKTVEAGALASSVAVNAAGTASAAAAVKVGLLARALAFLSSSTGIGAVITAVAVGLTYWSTRASDASVAMSNHQKVVDAVKNSYDKAGGSVEKWKKLVKEGTEREAIKNLQDLTVQLAKAREEAGRMPEGLDLRRFTPQNRDIYNQVGELAKLFSRSEIDLDRYRKSLSDLAKTTNDTSLQRFIDQLLESANGTRTLQTMQRQAILVMKTYSSDSKVAEAALKELNGELKNTSAGLDLGAKAGAVFEEALGELNKLLPDLRENLAQLKIDEAFAGAAQAATNMGQLNQAIRAYNDVSQGLRDQEIGKTLGSFSDGFEASKELIRQMEKFISEPKLDGNTPGSVMRAGYGSDTVELADGTIQKITAGMRVSVADAERDLTRRTREFQETIVKQIGVQQFGQFNPQQQAVLTSIAYNYGDLPDRLVEAIKTGTTKEIADAIRGLGSDNSSFGPGVNAKRRNTEANLFESNVGLEAQQKAAQKLTEETEKQKTATQERIAAGREELGQQELINAGKARQAEIEKAVAEAKKENPRITAEEIAEIERQTGKIYDLKAAKEAANEPNAAAEAAEQKVNDLLTRQQELRAQLDIYTKNGDTANIAATKTELEGVNTELTAAIDNAIKMWEAIGGTEAAAKIATLTTAKLEAQNLAKAGQQTFLDWERVGELFVSGLTNAFDRFAQAVAEGKNIGEAARDAFLQFAADFLIEIGKMIIRQALLNMLRSFGGPFAGLGVGTGHTGGVVGSARIGSGNQSRKVSPMMFANAPRFHGGSGGPIGLRAGELPAILKEGEEVLSENDPRNILNGGAAAGGGGEGMQPNNVRIVNLFDAADVVSQGLGTGPGETAVMNIIKSNAGTVRDIVK